MFSILGSFVDILKKCLPSHRRPKETASPIVEDIRANIESLPQELYDEIRDLSLGCQTGVRRIGLSYQPPVQLQISHAYRRIFSRAYYGNYSVLMVHNSNGGMMMFGRWIDSLSKETIDQLQQYGISDQAVLDDSVDIQFDIPGGMRLQVWCPLEDDDGWLRVLKIKLHES
jgi:hypothetical protein